MTTEQPPQKVRSRFLAFIDSLPGFSHFRSRGEKDALLKERGLDIIQQDAEALGNLLNTARAKGEPIDINVAYILDMIPDIDNLVVLTDGNIDFASIAELQQGLHERTGLDYTPAEAVLRTQEIAYYQRFHEKMRESVVDMVCLEDTQAKKAGIVQQIKAYIPPNLGEAVSAFGVNILEKIQKNDNLQIIGNRLKGHTPTVAAYYQQQAVKR